MIKIFEELYNIIVNNENMGNSTKETNLFHGIIDMGEDKKSVLIVSLSCTRPGTLQGRYLVIFLINLFTTRYLTCNFSRKSSGQGRD